MSNAGTIHRNSTANAAALRRGTRRIPIFALGMSLGIFLSLSYVICVIFDLLFPEHAMYRVWAPLLPGFTWISWSSFFIGLVETFAYGWYVALVFAPLYNIFSRVFTPLAGQE